MIHIYIYAHGSVIDDTITFMETDIQVVLIEDNDFLVKEDFDRLWLAVEEVDTTGLIPEKWYMIGFERVRDYTGFMMQEWFELVENPTVVDI